MKNIHILQTHFKSTIMVPETGIEPVREINPTGF